MRLVVVVQARMGSSRLPGKVLLPVGGEPLLAAMLHRVRSATIPFELVVATTWDGSDDPVAELCARLDVGCYRGHPTDLLDRHLSAARSERAEAVVKIPSDCPLIDPAIIDRVLSYFLDHAAEYDYVSNLHPATYPDGNDVEVLHTEVLEVAHREAHRGLEREHTTPFIWENPGRFRLGNVVWESGRNASMTHRFTVDYAADYRFVAAVFDELGGPRSRFGLDDILNLLERKPELAAINAAYAGVNWYRHHLHELRQVSASETRALEAE